MVNYNITPKSLILSLLEALPGQSTQVKFLVFSGKLFGFTDNTIRVTITRLIREGYIESDVRGCYRISKDYSPLIKSIRGWELGESRLVPWDGSWICCYIPKLPTRSKEKTVKILNFFSLKEGMPKIWVRPQNLKLEFEEVRSIMIKLGITENATFFSSQKFDKEVSKKWRLFLWPIDHIAEAQDHQAEKLRQSGQQIHHLPLDQALIETYLVGNEAIRLLHTDPLLPEEMMTKDHRLRLTRAMLKYNEIGKKVWEEKVREMNLPNAR